MGMIVKDFRITREALGITQDRAAKHIGVTRATYVKYEQTPEVMPLGKYMKLIQWFEKTDKKQKEQ